MAAALLLSFLFLLFTTRARKEAPSEVVGIVGGVGYLSPSPESQASYHQIHWRRGDTVRIASRDSQGKVQFPNNAYTGRLELFPNNSLKISPLQKTDSGEYRVYLEDEVGKERIERIFLKVYDVVPKPTVKVNMVSGDSRWCHAVLECSVELEGVTYEWIPPVKINLEEANGSKQNISFNPSVEIYTCRVSNAVSSNNASLTYRHPCSWTGASSASSSGLGLVAVGQGELRLPSNALGGVKIRGFSAFDKTRDGR
ncbi:PREDICTED: CD48 antigen-like [Mesitornis unicolor]|uniref:CD48 antigen-like n=1 Tax=Mesitornis unicolor TaxID=54374 RepID=UPI000528A7B8|nr:PREDICTED: CD48 antigen-like [Mesitornis unicolor]